MLVILQGKAVCGANKGSPWNCGKADMDTIFTAWTKGTVSNSDCNYLHNRAARTLHCSCDSKNP